MMVRQSVQLVAASLLISIASSQRVISLAGNDWTVSNAALNISVPGSLPSQAHLDLYANQIITDPYYGLNDFDLRWVAWANWTYTSAPISVLSSNAGSTWLLFNGLDTFTSIEFCGQHVASTNNQFRQYFFDVSGILSNCGGNPVLSINFGSAPKITEQIANEPGQETWPPGYEELYEFENRQFMRKEQSDFGWDWGPGFAPAGPWQPAWVVQLGSSEVHVRNMLIDIYRLGQMNNLPPDQSQPWVVNASVDYFGSLPSGASLSYKLTDINNHTVSSGALTNVTSTDSTVTGMTIIPNGLVDLWWPVNMGPQTLYYMTIDLVDASNKILASVDRRLGFRTIVLNEGVITPEQLSQGIAPGNNWHFEINGHEFYAKGSNFIPPDAFWPRVTETKIRQLFDSVVDGNQNMLRVWASGAYSPDFMYNIADERGILLWSEFEFSDSLYPIDAEFLANVAEEVYYNVRRVNHHPSLAFWAGNNEIENLAYDANKYAAPEPYGSYLSQYETLFLNTIVPILFGNSHSISYAPSSTTNGYLELNFSLPEPITERYFNLTPGSIYGESDFYNYDPSVLYNNSAYPISRFSNEFGFHSMPSLQSWKQAIPKSELYFNSSTIVLRNHHPAPGGLNTTGFDVSLPGMGQMTRAVQMWYPVPNKTDTIANFSAWCHTTQIFQADLYKSQIEFYRRGSGLFNRQMGSLYWQLEDIWQAPTWAGIEYDGRWKVLHYTAKDIYQPVIIAPYWNSTTANLQVWVTSDLWSPTNGTATFSWYDWTGAQLTVSLPSSVPVEIGPINSTLVLNTNLFAILPDADFTNVVMRMRVETTGQLPNSNITQIFSHENWFHASGLGSAGLVDPGLEVGFENGTGTGTGMEMGMGMGRFRVKAKTGVAAWVWLDYPEGAVVSFESNGFWLGRGEERVLGFRVKSDGTDGGWVGGVKVRSLWDNLVA